MNWFQRNFKTIIYTAFIVPIVTVAIVSISHVTKWYGISNPLSWAMYLSIGIEIAALSALAAISARMGRNVYFPFIIVTIIQFIGNIFFAYQYIDINGQSFKDWVDLVDPLVSYLGVESGDMISHKRFLALFAGGMLPLISLSFLHMLVKFEEAEKKKSELPKTTIDIEELSLQAGKIESQIEPDKPSISDNDLKKVEEILTKIQTEKFGGQVESTTTTTTKEPTTTTTTTEEIITTTTTTEEPTTTTTTEEPTTTTTTTTEEPITTTTTTEEIITTTTTEEPTTTTTTTTTEEIITTTTTEEPTTTTTTTEEPTTTTTTEEPTTTTTTTRIYSDDKGVKTLVYRRRDG